MRYLNFRTTASLVLPLAVPFLGGCASIGMMLDAATTSVPPPICAVYFNSPLLELPSMGSTGTISARGGFLKSSQRLTGPLKRLKPGYQERISNGWLAETNSAKSREPCIVKSALAFEMVLEEGTWAGEIPVEALPARPLFGDIWFDLKGLTLQVRLYEENGKNTYGANTGWRRAGDDKGVIAEVELQKQASK